ncbi:MAG: TonB-dependent receptor [Muribaculaceae bacterium]|nr:TonB-dependent receptor [Muribaculaceae bacterium]
MKNICFQMNWKGLMTMLLALCLAFPAFAQKITVQGTVVDPSGEPLIGASIAAKGTSTGTATDFDGKFSIAVEKDATLVVSYVGYETQNVAVNNQTSLRIVLKDSGVRLDEVVAIGYGTVKKDDATGSVAMVKPTDIEAGLATSAQDLLVGASPGVVVTSNGGNPTGGATIRIRGGSSLSASNDPLIVIDGVPMNGMSNFGGTDPMTMISPDNIESMTILKDASATAIYGSRASNGVIIITTKKGKAGKPQVNFSANFHVNTARNTLDVMNGDEFRDVVTNQLGESSAAQLGTANTNWQKEVLRTSFSHDYSLSVGGTAGFLPYRVSASYSNNQGILKTSGMQRTTVGFNLSPKFFNGLLQITANAKGAYIKSREADTGAIGAATCFNPTLPVYTDYKGGRMFNGYTNVLAGGKLESQAAQNPLQMLLDKNNSSEVWSSNGNLQIDYALHFLPELHFNLNLGYDVSKNTQDEDVSENSIMSWRGNYTDGAGTHYHRYELQRNTLLDFFVNYKKDFDAIKSNVDVMAGYSWQRFDYHGRGLTTISTLGYNKNYYDKANDSYILEYDQATESHIGKTYNDAPMTTWGNRLQLVSFFGRLNYSFDNTYLLTFTLRNDGTSRFSKENRWGLFPALALGWKITNLSFMEKAKDVMNEMKLRLGWGVTGQQAVAGYFPYLAVYSESLQPGLYPSPDGNGWISPLYPRPYDENIKWEETTTWNVGLDMAFLNNRFTVALDWYLRDTKDLLAHTPVAGVNTGNYMDRNIGSLRNYGVEATVGAKPVVTKDFTWSTSANVAWNRNEITKLTGNATTDAPVQAAGTPAGVGTGLQWHMVGEAANTFRVYKQVYDANDNPVPGQYVDMNADGTIDSNDLINYHSPDPKVTITWNNTFNYKNWDLGISLRANIGNYVYNGPLYDRTRLYAVDSYGLNNIIKGQPLFKTADNNFVLSDYLVENASFVRCDNITLGYTMDKLLDNALRLRIFGAVQNPFVITKYKGLDPEVYGGIDNNTYPRPVTVTLGVVATF